MKVSRAISRCVSKIVQKNKFVKDILDSIDHAGGKTLLVGGAVRDIFLSLPVKDLDFEVYGLALEQLQMLLSAWGTVSLVGKSFGVLKLHGLDADWSLPRHDSAGRHPVVTYNPYMSYEQAFIRRDLTINAMGIDMQTMELIDPFDGMHDLQAKILKAPDDIFFCQDPLRLLRVMQFASRFEMMIDDHLSQVCRDIDVTSLSIERVEQEFKKLFLQGTKPSIGLQWLAKIGKLDYYFPGLIITPLLWSRLNCAAKLSYQHDYEKLTVMYSILLSAVPHLHSSTEFHELQSCEKKVYGAYLKRLLLQDRLQQQIIFCSYYSSIIEHGLDDVSMKWLARWLSPISSLRFLAQYMVIMHGDEIAYNFAQKALHLNILDNPIPAILTGQDFLDVAQGPAISVLVKKAYTIQLAQNITDRDLLKKLTLL